MFFQTACYTDQGETRPSNQDSYTVKTAQTAWGQVALAVICDGMGGLAQGEFASAQVVFAFEDWFWKELPLLLRQGIPEKLLAVQWNGLVQETSRAIRRYGEARGIRLGTTVTALLMTEERYYLMHKNDEKILASLDDCGKYLANCFRNQRNETVMLLCLDAKCKVISCNEVGQGSVNSAAVPIRRVVEMALGVNASSAILAHNHPSGLAIPSGEDIQTTRRLALALDAVEIQLVDHIIVADSDYVSLRQSGLYHPDECRISL